MLLDPTPESVKKILETALSRYANPHKMSMALGTGSATIGRWISGQRSPQVEKFLPVMKAAGFSFFSPDSEPEQSQSQSQPEYSHMQPQPQTSEPTQIFFPVTADLPPLYLGDIAVVETKICTPADGKIVLLAVDTVQTLRRLQKISGGWILHSLGSPMTLTPEMRIVGTVVALRRQV